MKLSAFETLNQEVEDFCRFIEGLPEAVLEEGDWGPKGVLAHLVFYHEVYLSQAQTCLGNGPVEILQGRYRDLNAEAVERCRGVPVQELTNRLRAANCQLGTLYAACDPAEIIIPIKHGVRPYSLARLVPEVEAHVRNHLRQLKRELRNAENPVKP